MVRIFSFSPHQVPNGQFILVLVQMVIHDEARVHLKHENHGLHASSSCYLIILKPYTNRLRTARSPPETILEGPCFCLILASIALSTYIVFSSMCSITISRDAIQSLFSSEWVAEVHVIKQHSFWCLLIYPFTQCSLRSNAARPTGSVGLWRLLLIWN